MWKHGQFMKAAPQTHCFRGGGKIKMNPTIKYKIFLFPSGFIWVLEIPENTKKCVFKVGKVLRFWLKCFTVFIIIYHQNHYLTDLFDFKIKKYTWAERACLFFVFHTRYRLQIYLQTGDMLKPEKFYFNVSPFRSILLQNIVLVVHRTVTSDLQWWS